MFDASNICKIITKKTLTNLKQSLYFLLHYVVFNQGVRDSAHEVVNSRNNIRHLLLSDAAVPVNVVEGERPSQFLL